MSDQATHPLKFRCFNCKKQSSYPNYLKEGESASEVKSVIKRCLTCGMENDIDLPEGWEATNIDNVLRGYKKD